MTKNCFENGFEYIEIHNKAASAKIALQGAHIFHYERVGEKPLLWVSETSEFQNSVAIRGGVPICWPSFGSNNPDLPFHGFARVMLWRLHTIDESDPYVTKVRFVLEDNVQTRALWDYKFRVELFIKIADSLEMELKTSNLDHKPFILTQALHSYFAVSSIENITIRGLEGWEYLDALTATKQTQEGDIHFDREVDRVYGDVEEMIVLQDKDRSISIKNSGSKSVVVWNPWIEKCARMSGMKNDAYKEFVCIESANAYEDARVLQPNEEHTLRARISVI